MSEFDRLREAERAVRLKKAAEVLAETLKRQGRADYAAECAATTKFQRHLADQLAERHVPVERVLREQILTPGLMGRFSNKITYTQGRKIASGWRLHEETRIVPGHTRVETGAGLEHYRGRLLGEDGKVYAYEGGAYDILEAHEKAREAKKKGGHEEDKVGAEIGVFRAEEVRAAELPLSEPLDKLILELATVAVVNEIAIPETV